MSRKTLGVINCLDLIENNKNKFIINNVVTSLDYYNLVDDKIVNWNKNNFPKLNLGTN